jgi:hypothetical protein
VLQLYIPKMQIIEQSNLSQSGKDGDCSPPSPHHPACGSARGGSSKC